MIKPHFLTVTFSKMQNVNDSLNWRKRITNDKLWTYVACGIGIWNFFWPIDWNWLKGLGKFSPLGRTTTATPPNCRWNTSSLDFCQNLTRFDTQIAHVVAMLNTLFTMGSPVVVMLVVFITLLTPVGIWNFFGPIDWNWPKGLEKFQPQGRTTTRTPSNYRWNMTSRRPGRWYQ